MKLTNKEYPATHSMSTAWYAVDNEGNVAILDFNENGPQPDGIGAPFEYGIDDMSIEDLVEYCDDDVKVLPYTEEQVSDLLYMDMKDPKDIGSLEFNCIIRVADGCVDEFIRRAKKLRKSHIIRMCQDSPLFCVEASDNNFNVEMDKMVDEKIIVGGYVYDYYLSDDLNGNSVDWEKQFSRHPMYVYGQPYWYNLPMERVSEPEHPFKYDQLPELLKRKVLKLPILFRETEKLQIAEFSQFQMYSFFSIVYKGRYYEKLPLSNGEMKYFCSSVLPADSSIRCSLCGKCEGAEYLVDFRNTQYSDYPTVLILEFLNKHERTLEYDYKLSTEIFFRKSYVANLIHGYPGVGYSDLAPFEKQKVGERFVNCRAYMDLTVETLKPRVILLQDNALNLVKDFYKVDTVGHKIEICGMTYPFYLLSELKQYRDLINKLSQQPYIGRVLSADEKIVDVEAIEGDFHDIDQTL
ncbi:MAG: hypothetical protein IKP37_09655 [Paludibacteraceae bacterium]|nr:hypothetical protein [Paludibacteraceae bacterium]